MKTAAYREIQNHVSLFAQRYNAAPEGSDEREIQRRNLLFGIVCLAEQNAQDFGDNEAALAACALEQKIRRNPQWQDRARWLFSHIESSSRTPVEPALDVLQSLAAEDGRYVQRLAVFAPPES